MCRPVSTEICVCDPLQLGEQQQLKDWRLIVRIFCRVSAMEPFFRWQLARGIKLPLLSSGRLLPSRQRRLFLKTRYRWIATPNVPTSPTR